MRKKVKSLGGLRKLGRTLSKYRRRGQRLKFRAIMGLNENQNAKVAGNYFGSFPNL